MSVTRLRDHDWKHRYDADDADLVHSFYVPALSFAQRYDRSTGYFSASALALATRGIEHLVLNKGHMRLIVGCTLKPAEVDAIQKGLDLRQIIGERLSALPLTVADAAMHGALELLSWMVAKGYLDIKVAVPCDSNRNPIPADGIFHEKAGIVEDTALDRLAFTGSINETEAGWMHNWESFTVFSSWTGSVGYVDVTEAAFQRLWADKAPRARAVDLPIAVRDKLLEFLPTDDRPARLVALEKGGTKAPSSTGPLPGSEKLKGEVKPAGPTVEERRREAWQFVFSAAQRPDGGDRVGEATCGLTPWPHQVHAFDRMYDRWPPRLLIADEVGLGKTIEAGMLLRQAWLSGRAKRILIMAPKAVLRQWQIELREKFNLNWPIYDGDRLRWYPCRALGDHIERMVSRDEWHREPYLLVSSHLMRRKDRRRELLERAQAWDLVILDEAHHARREAAGGSSQSLKRNALLRLMVGLRERQKVTGLVLLTATPMQVHPIELWDLLHLLGLPTEWSGNSFVRYFELLEKPAPSHEELDTLARLFQAMERTWGEVSAQSVAARFPSVSAFKAKAVLKILRDSASTPRKQLGNAERKLALDILRVETPVRHLVSRHTRALLRRYYKEGKISTRIADREVEDRFVLMTPAERALYDAVEDYISSTYNAASTQERNAVGFVMTIYRRRLASSFLALARTLETRLSAVRTGKTLESDDEDVDEDDPLQGVAEEEAAELEQRALKQEELDDIEGLLVSTRRLPTDSKALRLQEELESLKQDGYQQVIVFTQYTDTMDFLRNELGRDASRRIMCFSGRGGEIRNADGSWRVVSREEIKQRFKKQESDLLLCTDAAAEGLNFQFCGALVNYDMPWNPMRVEQRIGRIDRLGQAFEKIRIVNFHYEDTVETDVYLALRNRISLFQTYVGKLQPILARLSSSIASVALAVDREQARSALVQEVEEATVQGGSGLDLDEATVTDFSEEARSVAPLDLAWLEGMLHRPPLLPPGMEVKPLGKDWSLLQPGLSGSIRITTHADYYEQHPESTELWSPGSVVFPTLDGAGDVQVSGAESFLAAPPDPVQEELRKVDTAKLLTFMKGLAPHGMYEASFLAEQLQACGFSARLSEDGTGVEVLGELLEPSDAEKTGAGIAAMEVVAVLSGRVSGRLEMPPEIGLGFLYQEAVARLEELMTES